ncbi:MAG: hypothetical protein JWL79_2417 [Frankiales bacterium]|nr:hypothetical protein [Frankiales bacterium]
MSVSKVVAAAWLSSALVVVGAAGGAIYQLANPSNSSSPSSAPSSHPSSPTLGGGDVSPNGNGNGTGNGNGNGNGNTTGNGNGTTGASTTGTGATTGGTGTATGGTTTGTGTGSSTGNTTGSNPGHPITVTGAVVGKISLGSPATLNVTIANPNNQDILITSVTGAITSVTTRGLAGLPPCSSSWYSVGSFTGTKTITKNSSGQVTIPLTLTNLPSTNQDNCKGSNVTFSFTAQARQA